MSLTGDQNSRAFYRLRYPRPAQPTVQIDGVCYPVSELSEASMKIIVAPDTSTPVIGPFVGQMTFVDQTTEVIKGELLRFQQMDKDDSEAVLHLTQGVPLKRMISEQVRIRKEYPRFIDPTDHLAVEDE